MNKANNKFESGGKRSTDHNSTTQDITPEDKRGLISSSMEISRTRNVIDKGF